MNKIFKYELPSPQCMIEMPIESDVLHVHEQQGKVCIWARVNPEDPLEYRHFLMAGTGTELPNAALEYLGTAHLADGELSKQGRIDELVKAGALIAAEIDRLQAKRAVEQCLTDPCE